MASKLTTLAQQKSAAELQTMSRQSFKWLMNKVTSLKSINRVPGTIKKEDFREVTRFALGGLYFFQYLPKGRDELPYYDTFPLVLILEKYSDGFLGLNLHYLPLKYRVAFMDKLMEYAQLNDDNDIRRIKITYDILNASRRFSEFKPCIKRYLHSHIKSRILAVMPNEWDVAIFLPIQQFKKAPVNEVWQDSVEQMKE